MMAITVKPRTVGGLIGSQGEMQENPSHVYIFPKSGPQANMSGSCRRREERGGPTSQIVYGQTNPFMCRPVQHRKLCAQ
jgi:hypothetical protein